MKRLHNLTKHDNKRTGVLACAILIMGALSLGEALGKTPEGVPFKKQDDGTYISLAEYKSGLNYTATVKYLNSGTLNMLVNGMTIKAKNCVEADDWYLTHIRCEKR